MKTISVNPDIFETAVSFAQAQPFFAFLIAMPVVLGTYTWLAGSFK